MTLVIIKSIDSILKKHSHKSCDIYMKFYPPKNQIKTTKFFYDFNKTFLFTNYENFRGSTQLKIVGTSIFGIKPKRNLIWKNTETLL